MAPFPLQLGVAGSTSLLCAHESRSIRVLDTDTGEEITEWVAHSGAILGVDVFPQQDFVASGGLCDTLSCTPLHPTHALH